MSKEKIILEKLIEDITDIIDETNYYGDTEPNAKLKLYCKAFGAISAKVDIAEIKLKH